jgi:hypothetical protein
MLLPGGPQVTEWIEAYCARCFWDGVVSAFGFLATFAAAWKGWGEIRRRLVARRNKRRY